MKALLFAFFLAGCSTPMLDANPCRRAHFHSAGECCVPDRDVGECACHGPEVCIGMCYTATDGTNVAEAFCVDGGLKVERTNE